MRRGVLDRIIDIEHRVITGVTDSNEPIYSWKKFKQGVFAEVYAKRGVELWSEKDSRRISETITRFRIDYFEADGINSTMRVRFDNQLYDIKAILPDHDRMQDCVIDALLQEASVQTPTLQVFTDPDLEADVGEVYQGFMIHIIGGAAPFSVGLTGASPPYILPAGLSLVQSSDRVWSIEGYPEESGSFPISVTVTDANSVSASTQEVVLVINGQGSP